MKDQKKAYGYALLAVALWSTVATAFKLALRDMDNIQLLFLSTVVSTVVLLLVVKIKKRDKQMMSQSPKDLGRSALMGMLNPCLYYLVLFKAYSILPAQEAQALNYTWAIALALLSVPFLGQKLTKKSLFAVIIGFIGVLVISTRGEVLSLRFTNLYGDLLAIGSSVIWASYWIANMKDGRDPLVKLATGFLFGSLYVTAALLLFSEPFIPTTLGLTTAVYVGLFEMGLTFVFFLKALDLSTKSSKVGNLIYLSPFLSMFFIYFILDERIYPATIIGLAMIILGILVQTSEKET